VPSHPEEWFKYNDSTVTKVQPEEVLSDTKSNATAYLAVYQRADRPGLVDTVHRTLF
jgi:ubiquitin carboxyl-terminal hydrolase 25/28